MQFGVLGPLQVAAGNSGAPQTLSAARLRTVLAVLLWRANQSVPVDELADLVWDGLPPAGAREAVRALVMRLRRRLDPQAAARIVTRAPGYAIEVSSDELDASRFEKLARLADSAIHSGRWADATQAATSALGLWRSTPLVDVPSQLLRDAWVPILEQLHAQVLTRRIEADLQQGNHEQLVPELQELTVRHPLRESFHGQLMLALARGGRRAEALAVYQQARRTLVDELGIEPGPELRRLHERILAGDESILAGDEAGPAAPALAVQPSAGAHAPRPRQLPVAPGHFTGRVAELESLTGLPEGGEPAEAWAGATVVIFAIDGMAGIGKTALAVHAAHRLADRFPDGQLFLDLHGYTQGHPPREPGQALEVLLRALGVPAGQIPEDVEERAALYRQRLAETRTLVLLDNARDEAAVRPLLPAAPGCLVLVTSRRRLKGLDDARSLPLNLLPPAEAAALLRAVAGPDRFAPDEPLLGELAELCGHLPLALRIAGALLRHRPAWSLQYLAGLLRDQRQPLKALSDGERDLGAVFDLSYTGLGEHHRTLFRRLGLAPGPDADAHAAAALLNLDPGTTTGLLEDLVDHNLLIAHTPGRYRMHDLIRAHAAALVAADPQPDRDAALDRLLRYYEYTAQSTSVPIARYPRPAPQGPAPVHAPALADPEDARAWLRAERENIETAYAYAHAHALDEHCLALATGLAEILRHDGPFTRAVILHQAAAETAERHGQPDALANALAELGHVRGLTGDYSAAGENLHRAVEVYRATGHRLGEASALIDLGRVRGTTGNFPAALEATSQASSIYHATGHRDGEAAALIESGTLRGLTGDVCAAGEDLRRAVEIYRATGNRLGEANALNPLGMIQSLTGDLTGALESCSLSLEICRALGNRQGEARALTKLGELRLLTGDHPAALDALTMALEIHRALGSRGTEAGVLTYLGDLRAQLGDYSEALDHITQALNIYRAIGDRANEAWALNHYAATVAASGDLPRALALYQQALAMNRELNKPDDEAVALEGLGGCHQAAGETESATDYLRQALKVFQRLGMSPDAERIRARLAALD